jgi:hypothetical protein
MNRFVEVLLIAVGVVALCPGPLRAQASVSPRLTVCSLLPAEEVKRHLPWLDVLDQMAPEEESIGESGSSCNYPSVFIQVLPASSGILELAREKEGGETVNGIGDEAYFHNNADRYAELYVRAGAHVLTVQANVNDSIEAVKPGVMSLARALIAELP